ncbi:hypothetical protein F2Q70_00005288 [Brassica cretica]|uniref:Uncharacterized protein n=1 Tax=Brassica cretica TaxID=69181 RepID=A0A8S9J1Y1_BRACR|nr:hypothetical protein F2Q70_00005288 [Brassica cretica]
MHRDPPRSRLGLKLKDFVTGFHKRKKKRSKESQKQQEESLRRKRIEARKKRKLEEMMLAGNAEETEDVEAEVEDAENKEAGLMLFYSDHIRLDV